jgi:nicotinate phosphoribosyltransferase
MKSITPEIGENRLSAYLDLYKTTMAQVALNKHPDAEVTFELKNRRTAQLLCEYVNPEVLHDRLMRFRGGWKPDEVAFLATQMRKGDEGPLFHQEFLSYLLRNDLPPVKVGINPQTSDLEVSTTGEWPLVTFWETVVMAEVNEIYFESYCVAHGVNPEDCYDEGDSRLSKKIAKLQARPDIKFADFGTRRRFSYRWHKHVLTRLAKECPDNLIGTSNIWLANEFSVMPIGTYAHEMPMVYAALAHQQGRDPLDGHRDMLLDWVDEYDDNLSTALTDTFTSDFFFADFTEEQAQHWQALRHDSGDPFKFGEQVIEFYQLYNIDPATKTIVFSDGLDIDSIIALADHFAGKINIVFGWGTSLTNDLGLPALNIVMKAVRVNGISTVKEGDDAGKGMGDPETREEYQKSIEARIAAWALELQGAP